MKYAVAVKGIIRRGDGRILVVRRSDKDEHKPGIWETVGGGIDDGETPQEALRREIKEEARISVEVLEPFNAFAFTRDTGESRIGITFLCEYLEGEVALSEEHSEYRWVTPQEFSEMKSIPSLQKEIERYAESCASGWFETRILFPIGRIYRRMRLSLSRSYMEEKRSTQSLYRSTDDRVLAGIFGGIGEHWHTDPVILRLLWILVTVFTGFIPGIVAYIVASLVIPERPRANGNVRNGSATSRNGGNNSGRSTRSKGREKQG